MLKTKKKSAFTLIELLVVIVIIGILATISVATFQGYFEKARLAKARSMEAQFQKLLLAQDAATEENLITAWYDYEGNSVSLTSPYVLDKMPTHNDLIGTDGITLIEQSDDTGKGSGKSLHIKGNAYRHLRWPTKNITISGWIKPDLNGPHDALYLRNIGSVLIQPSGTLIFNYISSNGNKHIVKYNIIKPDKWYYFIASYDGDAMRLWLDGKLIGKKTNVLPTANTSSNVIPLGIPNRYEGYIDDMIVSPYGFDGEKFK